MLVGDCIGAPFMEVSPLELHALVNEWWRERRTIANSQTIQEFKPSLYRDLARDS